MDIKNERTVSLEIYKKGNNYNSRWTDLGDAFCAGFDAATKNAIDKQRLIEWMDVNVPSSYAVNEMIKRINNGDFDL